VLLVLLVLPAWSATYYLGPNGPSNGTGTSGAKIYNQTLHG